MGIATAIVGSALIGGAVASRGASKQEKAIREGARQQTEATLTGQREALAATQPLRDLSFQQLNRLAEMYGPEGQYVKTPTMEELAVDPGFSFRMSEGEKALARMQSARGQYLGGGAIKAGVRYGQEMGSQEFQNAYNRLMNQRATVTNALLGIGGMAPALAGQQANIYTGTAANLANIYGGAAQGRASAYGAKYNALGQAIGQAGMGYGLYKGGYFDRIGGGQD